LKVFKKIENKKRIKIISKSIKSTFHEMRMSVCFTPPIKRSQSLREKVDFKYIPELCLNCNISKNKLLDIIKITFTEKARFSAFGFNKSTEEFWAKKFVKDKFLLHFTINIIHRDLHSSNIIITFLVADNKEVENLLSIVKNIIILYQTTSIINTK